MAGRLISVEFRTWTTGWELKSFSDWFDFADWLKQTTLQGNVVTIKRWEYV